MKNGWTEEKLSRLPEQFEQLNEEQYIQRRNIQLDDNEDLNETENAEPTYICESRIVSKAYYDAYMGVKDSPGQIEMLDRLTDISDGQTAADENILSIMEGMADLYVLLSQIVSKEG